MVRQRNVLYETKWYALILHTGPDYSPLLKVKLGQDLREQLNLIVILLSPCRTSMKTLQTLIYLLID